jgi:hypothetical protein
MVGMPETLTFAKVYQYDTRDSGITIRIRLMSGDKVDEFPAKIDTGASCCIFERTHSELLGIDIESGVQQIFSAATGSFLAYGHEVTLSVLGIETMTTVYFAADESFTRNVLGRQGWLDKIRLGLLDYEGKLFLSSYDDDF